MPTTTTETITIMQGRDCYRADDLRFSRLAAAVSYVERMGAEPAFDLPPSVQTMRELSRLGFRPGANGARS